MGEMGYGYGSEWHLLRYLGRHRILLNQKIQELIGGEAIIWKDQPFNAQQRFFDGEHEGLNFLPETHLARLSWLNFWPQTGSAQHWDAIGQIDVGGMTEWILVEAKAHVSEIKSKCTAVERGGLPAIRAALNQTKVAVGVAEARDWLCPYYQYANRMAALHFLRRKGIATRLLFIYFTGDNHPSALAPAKPEQWKPALDAMYEHLGLCGKSGLEAYTHNLFLPVCPG